MTEQDHPKISDQSCSDYEAFFLEALDMFPWFANIGNPIEGQDVRQVFSLKKAWECTQDDSWTYASFHADVDQSHALWAKAYDRALESVNNSGRNYELQEGIQVGLQAAWDAAGAAYQIATGNPEWLLREIDGVVSRRSLAMRLGRNIPRWTVDRILDIP